MQLTDILAQMGGLQSMARELGVSENLAASGAEALLPAILGGFKNQARAQPAGLEGLGGLLDQLGGGGLLDEVLAPQKTDLSHGDQVLGQIFGSKDVSRAVTRNAAAQTGLDPSLLKQMLPMLAMLAAGFMAKQSAGAAAAQPGPQSAPPAGPLGDLLGGLLGGGAFGGGPGGGGALGGGALGGGAPMPGGLSGLGALLDLNGDGNALDDILRMAGKAMR